MNLFIRISILGLLVLQGCASAPPVQNAATTKSYFDGAAYPGQIYNLSDDKTGAEQYRVFSQGSTGFVSIASVQSNAEGRAKDFCSREQKTIKVLQQQTSTPPHVLGNFPRVELVFICVDKSVLSEQKARISSDIKSSQGDVSATMDQGKQKCLDLGFKVGTESFGQCVLRVSK
ncbi:hypothetical protein [Polynucleobacter sp. MWH-Braz-FAM2G]|uniref:hypothetical protein n=1 Tax=Polynucleobacter sp. MWH-Braz-FAM2G TaxID=1855883 RepID=UPI001BFE82C9|nr:hypothetical protein [Polynucleobacter sp. MWH-Braz-FAM2G]QWD91627.1 hypothetical protein FD973_04675 [Polynucleobacter sp. MWH-Braz-FAM2G]